MSIEALAKRQWYGECPKCLSSEEYITTDVVHNKDTGHKAYYIRCLHCKHREKWYDSYPPTRLGDKTNEQ